MCSLLKLLYFLLLISNPREFVDNSNQLNECITTYKYFDSNNAYLCHNLCSSQNFRKFYDSEQLDLSKCPQECEDLMAKYTCAHQHIDNFGK